MRPLITHTVLISYNTDALVTNYRFFLLPVCYI